MLIDVLSELSAKHGWDIVYCVSEGAEITVKERFPSAIYQDTVDARYCRPPAVYKDLRLTSNDQPISDALAKFELLALKQMYRQELLDSFLLNERVLLFNRLVAYWSTVFDTLKPDVLLNPNPPHVCYDYIAHYLARMRGIRTIMFEWATSTGKLAVMENFGDGVPSIIEKYRELRANPPAEPVKLSGKMEEYWRSLQGTYDTAKPFWFTMNQSIGKTTRESTPRGVFMNRCRAILGDLLHHPSGLLHVPRQIMQAAQIAWAPPTVAGHYRGNYYKANEIPAALAHKVMRNRYRYTLTIRDYYDSLAKAPDLSVPYIYVPLHAQPERSTNPAGGVFDDQDVMIGLLSSVLPDGWRIYVKEHPSQFFPFFTENGRWKTTYDSMLAHPNVSFVPRDTPSFDLTDRAQTVASVSGTACWEAVARGKPSLMFGEGWYKGCEGVHDIRSVADCRKALDRIIAGERPSREGVRLFLHAIDQVCIEAYLNDEDVGISKLTQQENANLLASTIVAFYRSGAHPKFAPSGMSVGQTRF
ncbi:MAG: capsular biosynthesis protein [Xanthobacteraceae bacterium]|nr:capsular biosynthesis protein [Xanthobacteraceae bacterium]